MLVFSCTVEVA